MFLVTNQEYTDLVRGAKELGHHRHVTSSEFFRLQETTGMSRECVRHSAFFAVWRTGHQERASGASVVGR